MPPMFSLDGQSLEQGSNVYDKTMGAGVVLRIATDYVEVSFENKARVIYNHAGEVAGQRRLFVVPPALFSFDNAAQRTLALGIMALLGATHR